MNDNLSHQPESWRTLRHRYQAAIEPFFDCTNGKIPSPLPSELHAHIFDWEDGLRMIISRDCTDQGTFLHMSCSVKPDSKFWHLIRSGAMDEYKFIRFCSHRFFQLSDDGTPFDACLFITDKNVPHWLRKLE